MSQSISKEKSGRRGGGRGATTSTCHGHGPGNYDQVVYLYLRLPTVKQRLWSGRGRGRHGCLRAQTPQTHPARPQERARPRPAQPRLIRVRRL